MDKKPFISLKVRISIGVVSVCLLLGLLAVLLMNRIARDIVDEEYTDDAEKISKAVVSALDVGDVKELTDIVMGIYEEAGEKYFSEFVSLCSTFITLFKSRGGSVEELDELEDSGTVKQNYFYRERTRFFLKINKMTFFSRFRYNY